MLGGSHAVKTVEEFSLGPSLGQCCGGRATVLFEYFPATLFTVVLFGGGHVGTALVKILRELPCKFDWIDSREDFVTQHSIDGSLQFHESPEQFVQGAPAFASYLIMTHDHSLDYVLCEEILSRQHKKGDVTFCGLIGSKSKSSKFRKRLAFKEFDPAVINQLKCPIGLADIPGKRPMEVAVSIAAELIQLHAKTDSTYSKVDSNVTRENLLKLIQN
jgi:xanthine dehydrogenase accessory factor